MPGSMVNEQSSQPQQGQQGQRKQPQPQGQPLVPPPPPIPAAQPNGPFQPLPAAGQMTAKPRRMMQQGMEGQEDLMAQILAMIGGSGPGGF